MKREHSQKGDIYKMEIYIERGSENIYIDGTYEVGINMEKGYIQRVDI